jgi:hypothetical protein
MRVRLATLSFALLTLASAAVPARAEAPSLVGNHWCQVEKDDIVYAPQRCSIRRTPAGALLFEKVGGSQRFSGVILAVPSGGFRFTGLFFCPYGACDELFESDFTPVEGGFRGRIPVDQVVTVTRRRPTRPATP